MPESSLVKKLVLKPGYRVLLLNAPAGYQALLGELPPGVILEETPFGHYDLVQGFVKSKAEAETLWPGAVEAVRPGGVLWMSYPKKTSSIKTDINRDSGWESLKAAGWDTVAAVALDDTWSALRFRPKDQIGK
ncbi:MAG: hypothetical protein J0I20_31060 [Chloroflexi bacterium]|nr:hypothetical protein [Chloroflexota bacterium]OJV94154.1 MAG: hypothetical protein BGO39_11855 [Chloroflexi bacterium 54-19]